MNKLRYDRETVFTERPPFPNNILVEVTNACNHNCIFCGHRKMNRKIGFINTEFLLDIIKQAYEAGSREIGFYMTGEPLLCKELEQFIEHSKKIGYDYIYITTNGAFAEPERIISLAEKGLSSIKFSINAGTAETYHKIHGRNDFDKVISNVKGIYKLKTEMKMQLPIFLSYIKTTISGNETDLLLEEIGDCVDDYVIMDMNNVCDNIGTDNENYMINKDKRVTTPCSMVFNRLHITYEGYLNACCIDFNNYLVCADLHKTSLKEAWYSKEFIELRKQHLSGTFDNNMCSNCINGTSKEIIKPILTNIMA